MTGESFPQEKKVEDEIYAGTLDLRAKVREKLSQLARIQKIALP